MVGPLFFTLSLHASKVLKTPLAMFVCLRRFTLLHGLGNLQFWLMMFCERFLSAFPVCFVVPHSFSPLGTECKLNASFLVDWKLIFLGCYSEVLGAWPLSSQFVDFKNVMVR